MNNLEDEIRAVIFKACMAHDKTGESSYDMEARRIMIALNSSGYSITKNEDINEVPSASADKVVNDSIAVKGLIQIILELRDDEHQFSRNGLANAGLIYILRKLKAA